jgi:hypothetical protein
MAKRAAAHLNLHLSAPGRAVYSIVEDGRVVDRTSHLVLSDVTLTVAPAGRARVLREGQRNVHAFVRGVRASSAPEGSWVPVTYRPAEAATFTRRDTGEPVLSARYARLTPTGVFVLL